ncbi:MAG: hypothetical protein JWO03_109 [Bacteroidetes bacterium]|nr:hypothetical protein [Bacteroidota bacterium]
MKQGLLLLISFLFLTGAVSAQSSFGESMKAFVIIPKGTLDGKEVKQFYMSATEVTNKQYREFIQALRLSGDTAKLRIAMVDTAQWLKDPYDKPYADYYFQHKAYDNYPVVNVTRRGALLYCEWLTEKFRKGGKTQMHVTLPDETQWEYAAKGGDPKANYPWEGNSLKCEKKGKWYGTYMCNYFRGLDKDHPPVDTTKFNPNADITAPAESYMPNGYKLWGMCGNVAEMLTDKNYTKGGGWYSPAAKVNIAEHENNDPNTGSKWVGFRPVIW